jgi:hypothetical protein
MVVDGILSSEFDTVDAASARKLKSTYPMRQIKIYEAAKRLCQRHRCGLIGSSHKKGPALPGLWRTFCSANRSLNVRGCERERSMGSS